MFAEQRQAVILETVHRKKSASLDDSFAFVEYDVTEKDKLFTEEKDAIARSAASLAEDGDFVFIHAGKNFCKGGSVNDLYGYV